MFLPNFSEFCHIWIIIMNTLIKILKHTKRDRFSTGCEGSADDKDMAVLLTPTVRITGCSLVKLLPPSQCNTHRNTGCSGRKVLQIFKKLLLLKIHLGLEMRNVSQLIILLWAYVDVASKPLLAVLSGSKEKNEHLNCQRFRFSVCGPKNQALWKSMVQDWI